MSALSNLQSFNAQSKLKQATFAFIASQLLSKQEKEQIDRVFRAMDLNGDGKLSKDEIKGGYAEYFGRSLNDEEVDEMFDKVDADGSGAIDYSEFVVATMNEKNLLSNNKLQSAFKMFDKDGGGSISIDEIKQVLSFGQNLDEEVVKKIINQVDADGDGEISFDEFAQMMLKNIQWISKSNKAVQDNLASRRCMWPTNQPIIIFSSNIECILRREGTPSIWQAYILDKRR